MRHGGHTVVKAAAFSEKIKVITVNVNGFRSRESELRKYVNEQGNNCVFALNDTRLTHNVNVRNIPGYSMIRKDRELSARMATAGGVAFLIPSRWSCSIVNIKVTGDEFEALAAIIIPPGENSKPFKLLTIYNHPKNHFPAGILTEFKAITFEGHHPPGLLVGDLNCPHSAFGSRTTNCFGSKFLQLLNQENLTFFNDRSPTYFDSSSGEENVLDIIIGEPETSRYIDSCYVEGNVGSDHLPVITRLCFTAEKIQKEKLILLNGQRTWMKSC